MANTNWENLPSTNTPINETNLNKISNGLVNVSNEVDNTYKVNFLHSKNLFNLTSLSQSGTVGSLSGNVITMTWTAGFSVMANETTPLDSSKTYTISYKHKGDAIYVRNIADGDTNIQQTNTDSDFTNYSFQVSGKSAFQFKFVRVAQASGTCQVKDLQIQEGNVATSYEPYITPSIYVDSDEIYSKPVVLWENNSPSSNFASQTITLNDNISNYEYYEIIYQLATSGNVAINTGKIPTNLGCYMLSISNYMRRRTTGTPSGTSLQINDCYFNNTYGTAGTVQNDNLIPYQILGYK